MREGFTKKFHLSGRWQRILRYILFMVMALILLSFIIRTPLVSWYIHRKADHFNQSGRAVLKIDKISVRGLASILVTGISLRPTAGDTLLKIDSAYASIGILKLFAGRLALHDVRLINTTCHLETHDSISNYDFLLTARQAGGDTLPGPVSYAETSSRLMRLVFDKIPLSLNIRNFTLKSITGDHHLELHIDRFALAEHYFRSEVAVSEDGSRSKWIVSGKMDNHNHHAEFRLYPADSGKLVLPFIQFRYGARIEFDTLAFSLAEQEQDTMAQISGFITFSGLRIDHRRIAAVPVEFEKTGISYLLNVGTDFVELDSATRVSFNRIDFRPYLRYRPKPTQQVTLRIHKPQFPAQDLFSSFPPGLFTNLDGIKVKGNLSWNLDFFVDLSIPDSLRFFTSLDRYQFGVLNYGNANLSKLTEPFEYTAYDHDVPVRTFTVGPENPDFRPLSRISHYLQSAIMTSEDGAFYQHRGFLPEAFRESIITNIKERRFARGGSTISMQLVKNVYLSRNKTIARKMEEALIVWLIENQGICTKERMYEVYLNIIEWGPLIYGASEASKFYFAKDVAKLTLAEAIFMASIIPRPKWFRYSFTDDGHLRESAAGFYKLVSEKMVNKGWITPQDAEKLVPDVALKGPARLLLMKPGSMPPDSLPEGGITE